MFLQIQRRVRSQAIVNKNIVALFDEIGGDGKQSLRHHPVGYIGDVTFAGESVESPRMNKDNALFLLNRRHHYFVDMSTTACLPEACKL